MEDSQRANNIGALRMLGALAVLFAHAFTLTNGPKGPDPLTAFLRTMPPWQGLSGTGVAMFFAISGYLVTRSFARRGLVAYAEARVLRIYPALVTAVGFTVVLGFLIAGGSPGYWASDSTISYAAGNATLLRMQEDLPGVFESNPIIGVNGSLWTLPVELRMYVLIGIAGALGAFKRRAAFNLAVLTIAVVGFLWPVTSRLVAAQGSPRLAAHFFTGALLFVNHNRVPLTDRGAAAAVAIVVLATFMHGYELLFWACFSYLVLWIGFHPRLRLPRLDARGDLSYGTYLYAFPVTQTWVLILAPVSPWIVLALTVATVVPIAWVSWHVVEKRALGLKGLVSGWFSRVRLSRTGASTLLVLIVLCGAARVDAADGTRSVAWPRLSSGPLEDNSFLIEEAYNQEAGVVQHIVATRWDRQSRDWQAAFTQEWPVPDETHQLSFTVPYTWLGRGGADGPGDVLLNYRYQLLREEGGRPALAPRVSLVLPTGSVRDGLGDGSVGVQTLVPASRHLAEHWTAHLNAGVTIVPHALAAGVPGAERLVSWTAGGSLVWEPADGVNVLGELLGGRDEAVAADGVDHRDTLVFDPGVRMGWNLPDGVQLVAGVGVPIGLTRESDDLGVFLYLSVEHAVTAAARAARW